MFRHIVLLTLHPTAGDEVRDEIVWGLRELPARIPELVRYEVGTDLGLGEGNATIAVVADFADRAGWETYRDHPDHVTVIQTSILPNLASRTAAQMELPDR